MNSYTQLYRLILGFVGILLLTFVSCKEDDDNGGMVSETTIFYSDADNVFSFNCIGDDIEFVLDITADITDNIGGDFPDKDIFRIYVDYNNNGVLDSGIDLMLSPFDDGRLCVVSLISQSSTSGCSFFNDTTVNSRFSSTDEASAAHVNHTVTIPKERLSNDSGVGVAISIYDAEAGWTTYPMTNNFFADVLDITW